MPLFDTGFDHETTLQKGIVSGVRPGGPAERAGLRDGMKLARWSVNFGAVDQPIQITVHDEAGDHALSYLPHGATVHGYRLERRAR